MGKETETVNNSELTRKDRALMKLSAMSNSLLSRLSFISRAGLTHDDARDLWTVFGYKRDLRPEDLYVKYRRQDIAKTIVEAAADAVWTRPPDILADNEFQSKWNDLVKAHSIWSVFNRADHMLGWSRFSIIIVGVNDGKKLEQPVIPGNWRVTYLQPHSELTVEVTEFDTNTASPRFGQPLFYSIKINETESTAVVRRNVAPRVTARVHYSRVIHMADNIVEDVVYGVPRLEPVFNNLTDLLKTVGGSAETYWMTANRGMQVDVDKDMQLAPEDEDALENEFNEYYHGLRRMLRTRGVEIKELGSRVADPSQSVMNIIAIISATTRIPQRLLMGSEAGQLASEQDRANWAERINERRSKFAQPHAILPAMLRFANMGVLPLPTDLQFEWPEAFILGPLERAQTSAQKARSAANLSRVLTDQKERDDELLSIQEARSIIGFGDETKILETTPIEKSSPSEPA